MPPPPPSWGLSFYPALFSSMEEDPTDKSQSWSLEGDTTALQKGNGLYPPALTPGCPCRPGLLLTEGCQQVQALALP